MMNMRFTADATLYDSLHPALTVVHWASPDAKQKLL